MTFLSDKVVANFKLSRTERMARAKAKPRERRARRDGNDLAYLDKLRQLPCVICGNPAPNTVHHLKDTGMRGAGMRSPDKFGLPMCMAGFSNGGDDCHGQIERIRSSKELRWFEKRGIDAISSATRFGASNIRWRPCAASSWRIGRTHSDGTSSAPTDSHQLVRQHKLMLRLWERRVSQAREAAAGAPVGGEAG